MREIAACHKNARISTQKARLVVDQIRGMAVARAMEVLTFSTKKSAKLIKKVLNSAIANAEHNFAADVDELKVSSIYVDQATAYKRLSPRAKGRSDRILKPTSHITVKVSDGKEE